MKSRKIAVVGANGYIGRHTVKRLKESDLEILSINSSSSNMLTDPDFWKQQQFESVIWLASKTNPYVAHHHPEIAQDEYRYFSAVCDSLAKNDLKLIFASSGGAIYSGENPPFTEESEAIGFNEYGKLKAQLEQVIFDSGIQYSILRLANAYGKDQVESNGQAVIASWLSKSIRHQPIVIYGDSDITRDFIHIDDVTSAIKQVVIKQQKSEIFNIGSGVGTTLGQVVEILRNVTRSAIDLRFEASRGIDRREVWLDITKAKQLLNWQPAVRLEEGISEAWQVMNFEAQR